MSPVVRVDAVVWDWLKSQARPFEDTPNSVLRRVAGIDPPLPGEQHGKHAPQTSPKPHHVEVTKMKVATPPVRRIHQTPKAFDLGKREKRVTGEWLNKAFKLGARHALYHKDGLLYEVLTSFPGALCDAQGYVSYETEAEFQDDDRIAIGDKVNVRGGLKEHPRYVRFPVEPTP